MHTLSCETPQSVLSGGVWLVVAGCDALMPGPLVFILTLMGVFEGFLFSLFTCIMFCTQIHAICTDETVSPPPPPPPPLPIPLVV